MPKINVVKPFTLSLSATESIDFLPGTQKVSAEIASHWFVQAHCEKNPDSDDVSSDADIEQYLSQIAALQQQLSEANASTETVRNEQQALKAELEARDLQIAALQQQLNEAVQGKKK